VLIKVDMHYKRPIPKAEWDRRIKEMQDEFVKQNGLSDPAARSAAEWEKSIDEIKTALASLGLSLGMRIDPNVLGALNRTDTAGEMK